MKNYTINIKLYIFVFRAIKSRRMRGAGLVARMGRQERCIHSIGNKTWGKEATCKT